MSLPFVTENVPPYFGAHLQHPSSPWKASDSLASRTRLMTGETQTEVMVKPSDPDWDFVWQCFYFQKPTSYCIKRIYYIHSPFRRQVFESALVDLDGKALRHPPAWPTEPQADQRHKVNERWRHMIKDHPPIRIEGLDNALQKVKVLPTWHGCRREEVLHSICNDGFVIFGKHNIGTLPIKVTDAGYFGSGACSTPSVKYAVDTYNGTSKHVLLCLISTANPFHVVSFDKTLATKTGRLEGRGAFDAHDAHYIPVIPDTPGIYLPTKTPNDTPLYDEFVVFSEAHILPYFRVELQSRLVSIPFTTPQNPDDLIDHILKVLQDERIKNDSELRHSLKVKATQLFHDRSWTAEDLSFFESLSALFNAADGLNEGPRNNLVRITKERIREESSDTEGVIGFIRSQIADGLFKEASESFKLIIEKCQRLYLLGHTSDMLALYELLPKFLFHISIDKKEWLLHKIVTPLREINSPVKKRIKLEVDLALWFTTRIPTENRPEQKIIDKNYYKPALACYIRAISLAEKHRSIQLPELYEKATEVLLDPIFDRLKFFEKAVDEALERDDQKKLEDIVRQLSFIRNTICIENHQKEKLIKLFKKCCPFFARQYHTSPVAHLIAEGQYLPRPTHITPYVKRVRDAVRTWKSFLSTGTGDLFTDYPKLFDLNMTKGKFASEDYDSGISLLTSILAESMEENELENHFRNPVDIINLLCNRRIFETEENKTPLLQFLFQSIACRDIETEVPYLLLLINTTVQLLLREEAPLSAHDEIYRLLSTKSIHEPLRERYIDLLPPGPTKEHLSLISNRSGYRQKMRLEQERLENQILSVTQIDPTSIEVTSAFFEEKRYLKREIIDDCMTEEGNLKSKYQTSLHNVCRVMGPDYDLHFKQQPLRPSVEHSVYSLTSLLCGKGVPPSQLVRLDIQLPNGQRKSYPLLVSQTVIGKNLKELLSENPQPSFDNVHTTRMLLASLLKRPADDRAENIIVTEKGEPIFVDSDASFAEPLVQESWMSQKVNFCSILFCLDLDPLSKEVLEEWKRIDPDLLVDRWLKEIAEREQQYLSLFSELERTTLFEDSKFQFTPTLLLRKGTMISLYTQLRTLQKSLKENPPENALDLLKLLITTDRNSKDFSIGQNIFCFYEQARRTQTDPNARLIIATQNKEMKNTTTSVTLKTCLDEVPTAKEIESRQIYTHERMVEEFEAFSLSIAEGFSERIVEDNGEKKAVLALDLKSITKDGAPDIERQKMMIETLKRIFTPSKSSERAENTNPNIPNKQPEKKPEILCFKNCATLTTQDLISFLHPNLQILDLTGSLIDYIPPEIEQCQQLKELYLSGCPKIPNLEKPGWLSGSPYQFPHLEKLHISGCDRLTSLQIEATNLKELKANNNKSLSKAIVRASFEATINVDQTPLNLQTIIEESFPEFAQQLSPDFCRLIRFHVNTEANQDSNLERTIGNGVMKLFQRKIGATYFELEKHTTPPELLSSESVTLNQHDLIAIVPIINYSRVISLKISDTHMGIRNMELLSRSLQRTSISKLDIALISVNKNEINVLATALPQTQISTLSLLWNYIEGEGAKYLVTILPKTKINTLTLRKRSLKESETQSLTTICSEHGIKLELI